jgi:hypothetical protein
MRKGITSLPAARQTPSPQAIAECRRRALAEQGDVWGLLDALSQANPASLNWKVEFDQILDLMLARSHKHPQKFAGEVLDRLAAVSAFFMLRTELYARQVTRSADDAEPPHRPADLSRSVVEHFLPRYQELGRFTAEILHYRASIARQWALAKAKEAEADRLERKDRGSARQESGIKSGRPKSSTNGHNGQSAPRGNNGHSHPPGGNVRFSFPP